MNVCGVMSCERGAVCVLWTVVWCHTGVTGVQCVLHTALCRECERVCVLARYLNYRFFSNVMM